MKNWKTTLAGALAGIPPVIIGAATAAHYTLSPLVIMVLMSISGAGAVFTGLFAKDSTTHSTSEEVSAASNQA